MILILAYGNNLRSDDGAGLVLGEKIFRHWSTGGIPCRLIQAHQLLPEHAEEIAKPDIDAVVFCDTAEEEQSRPQKITFRRVSPAANATPAGHFFSPEGLLATSLTLYHAEPPSWIITIPGSDFQHGEEFSPEVKQLILDFQPSVNPIVEAIFAVLNNNQKPFRSG
jgi:hydrogenase maturation protease